tara:strand:+ start:991 stop:1365 length:375 start_codon:yes stop_codon:yes gene_type:complete
MNKLIDIKRVYYFCVLLCALLISIISYGESSTSFSRTEEELLDSGFNVLYVDSNFDFYGCTQNKKYQIGKYDLVCKEHTNSFSYDSIKASLLEKKYTTNNNKIIYYYLCIENTFCYRVNLKNSY